MPTDRGIKWRCSPLRTPQVNGIAERAIKQLTQAAQSRLVRSGRGEEYWFFVVADAAYNTGGIPPENLGDETPCWRASLFVNLRPAPHLGIGVLPCTNINSSAVPRRCEVLRLIREPRHPGRTRQVLTMLVARVATTGIEAGDIRARHGQKLEEKNPRHRGGGGVETGGLNDEDTNGAATGAAPMEERNITGSGSEQPSPSMVSAKRSTPPDGIGVGPTGWRSAREAKQQKSTIRHVAQREASETRAALRSLYCEDNMTTRSSCLKYRGE